MNTNPYSFIGLYNKSWVRDRAYKNFKKVEHIYLKSVKMELTRNQNGGQNMLYNYFTENYSDCKVF